jgi:hypothetical protein
MERIIVIAGEKLGLNRWELIGHRDDVLNLGHRGWKRDVRHPQLVYASKNDVGMAHLGEKDHRGADTTVASKYIGVIIKRVTGFSRRKDARCDVRGVLTNHRERCFVIVDREGKCAFTGRSHDLVCG